MADQLIVSSPRLPAHASALANIIKTTLLEQPAGPWALFFGLPEVPWIEARHQKATPPTQGWKIHVSATVTSAISVLTKALPVLSSEPIAFKIAASEEVLAELNEGHAGLSQIGKFLTIYPNNDAQAVRIATALSEATRGERGPRIPTDHALTDHSLVHYRYGGFMPDAPGELFPSIHIADGTLVRDSRVPFYQQPNWVADPFSQAGVADTLQTASPLLAERYLLVANLEQSARGSVHLAVDLERAERCILKQARRDAVTDMHGRDARNRLTNEASILRRLIPHSGYPHVIGGFSLEGDEFLVLNDAGQQTLGSHLEMLKGKACLPPWSFVCEFGAKLAEILSVIHKQRVIHRDIKLSNILLSNSLDPCVIDFDISYQVGQSEAPYHFVSLGYSSPQQMEGLQPSVSDDIYALGAVLYGLTSGIDPSLAPDPNSLMKQDLARLNPTSPPRLNRIIAKCLERDPSKRFPDMPAVRDALAEMKKEHASLPGHRTGRARLKCSATLEQVEARIAGHSHATTSSRWESPPGLFLYSGTAGVLLAMLELAGTRDDLFAAREAALHAHHIVQSLDSRRVPLGLYDGLAGLAILLGRASDISSQPTLLSTAAGLSELVANAAFDSPDMISGAAGRILASLSLMAMTSPDKELRAAERAGDWLISSSEKVGDNMLTWRAPPGSGSLTGERPCGFAHGAAGIGFGLLRLYEATAKTRFLDTAISCSNWLQDMMLPALPDKSGAVWPRTDTSTETALSWCHGSAGIGAFFLCLYCVTHDELYLSIAKRAGYAVANATWLDGTLCHGLSGSIQFLMDLWTVSGETIWLSKAQSLGLVLLDWALASTSAQLGLMDGDAGVALTLARLANSTCGAAQPLIYGTIEGGKKWEHKVLNISGQSQTT